MVLFLLLAAITAAGALGSILLRNLVHCILSLILFFFGVACLYILLQAEFIAVVQVLIYVGAVATLALFAIMLTRQVTGMELKQQLGQNRWIALGVGVAVLSVLIGAVTKQTFPAVAAQGRVSAEDLGRTLVTAYAVPFEIASVLLTAAMIGAIVVAMEQQHKTADRQRNTEHRTPNTEQ